MNPNLWSSPGKIAATALTTVLVYVLTLAAVRIAGRRTTAQLSAFDSLITIALGTAIATTALPAHPAVSDGVTVLFTLLLLQVVIGFLRRRSALMRRLVDFDAKTIVRDGRIDRSRSVLSAQLTSDEIRSELRRHGLRSIDEVGILVLEPDGRFSVIRAGDDGERDLWPDPEVATRSAG